MKQDRIGTHTSNIRKRRVIWLLFVISLGFWIPSTSCSYFERFIILIDEGQSFPCVGAFRFAFVLEALEQGQDALTSEKASDSFQPGSLYWNEATGKCQLPDGILLKNIPYGGNRKITINTYDSSGQAISLGSSPTFLLEASGSNVQNRVTVSLIRGCRDFDPVQGVCGQRQNVGLGTLIVRFDQTKSPVPVGTSSLVFVLPESNGLPKQEWTVPLSDGTLPSFLIISNVPSATDRAFSMHALSGNKETKRWGGNYTIAPNPGPGNATFRLVPTTQ